MGGAQPEGQTISRGVIGAAAAILIGIMVALGVATHRQQANPNAVQPLDPYAGRLTLSGITLSEATSGTGGKITYVDGTVSNTGERTVTGATVQVSFARTDGSGPIRYLVPVQLIRTHEPYVDTQPISAAPIPPGQQREFRLIFESIPDTWNVQSPEIRLVHTDLK